MNFGIERIVHSGAGGTLSCIKRTSQAVGSKAVGAASCSVKTIAKSRLLTVLLLCTHLLVSLPAVCMVSGFAETIQTVLSMSLANRSAKVTAAATKHLLFIA